MSDIDGITASLAQLILHPDRISEVPRSSVAALRGKLSELDTMLLGALFQAAAPTTGTDRLLDAKEAASRLGMSIDYVYKHATEFPFAAHEGRRVLFSEQGIGEYLKRKIKK
jgi:predicted DNA-binding transcriptional regulator AlpA